MSKNFTLLRGSVASLRSWSTDFARFTIPLLCRIFLHIYFEVPFTGCKAVEEADNFGFARISLRT
jgi:hypothetical protein